MERRGERGQRRGRERVMEAGVPGPSVGGVVLERQREEGSCGRKEMGEAKGEVSEGCVREGREEGSRDHRVGGHKSRVVKAMSGL